MRDVASLVAHAELPTLGPLTLAQLDVLVDALPPVRRALDLGAGRADVALRVHQRRGASVVAIERSPALAAEAHRRCVGASVEVVEGDASDALSRTADAELAIVLGSTGVFGGWWPTLTALASVPVWLVGDLVSDAPETSEPIFGPLPTGHEVHERCRLHGEVRARVRVDPAGVLAYERRWTDTLALALTTDPAAPWASYAATRRAAFATPEARRALDVIAFEALVVDGR